MINKSSNPDYWRKIKDHLNQTNVTLTDKQLRMLDRIR